MTPYRRKLSNEDADTGSILITKDRWHDFPEPMVEFPVRVGGCSFITNIVAEPCQCRPPAHEHRHLQAGHLRGMLRFQRGDTIEVTLDYGVYALRNCR